MIHVIDLTKNDSIIFINLTRNTNNNNNNNQLQNILKQINPSKLKTSKHKAMYTLAKRNNTPMKERLHAARILLKQLTK